MLSSISPVGEAARRQRWPVTVSAYLIASTGAGAAAGAALGTIGVLLGADRLGPTAALVVIATAVLLDATTHVPTVHRQVDERWLDAYRGWVYGAGYGAQLGLGLVTIAPTAAVHATWALALMTGATGAGAMVGGAFGLVRAVPLLLAGRVGTPEGLRRLLRRMDRARSRVTKLTVPAQIVVLVAGMAAFWT